MFRDLDCSIKRYFNIFLVKPRFLLILLLIPLAFYTYTLLYPVSYEVSNSIPFPGGISLELPGEDNNYLSRELFLRDPDIFFLNTALITELDHLVTGNWENEEDSVELAGDLMRNLNIELAGQDLLNIRYSGSQLSFGELVVSFYTRKLMTHAFRRTAEGEDFLRDNPEMAGAVSFSRALNVEKNYSLWDQRRLRPLIVVTIVSLLFMIAVVGVVDWLDSSLKTEPQAVRYLDLPVLGSIPNVKELGASLDRGAEPTDT